MSTTNQTVTVSRRRTSPRDIEIGRRIRALRLERGITQTQLGNLLGVTFQQIQKYEKGANRVAAARLQRVAQALDVPIMFFYTDPPATEQAKAQPNSMDVGFGFLQTTWAVRLMRAFSRIQDVEMRKTLVALAERVAGVP
jgi:transcriptional regulator with XRE-family HTH domain